MTLGFADEIQAGGESLLNSLTGGRVGAPYRQSLERQRNERAAFAGDNPWASGLATGAGAVVPGAMSAGARLIAAPVTNAAPGAFQLLRESLFGGGAPVRPVNTVVDAVREGARAGAVPGFVAGAGTAQPDQRLESAILGGGSHGYGKVWPCGEKTRGHLCLYRNAFVFCSPRRGPAW